MGLRGRVTLVFGVLIALMLVLGALVIRDFTAERTATQLVADVLDPAAATSHELAAAQAGLELTLATWAQTADDGLRPEFQAQLAVRDARLAELQDLAADDPALTAVVDPVASAIQASRARVTDPVLSALDAGRVKRARTLAFSPAALDSATAIRAATRALFGEIATQRAQAATDAAALARTLGITLLIAILGLVAAALVVLQIIRRTILVPIDALRADVRAATLDRQAPIIPGGPSDLQALTADVEGLRRELVTRIDDAAAARAALLQDAPLVAELQAMMQPSPPTVSWLEVAGVMRAEEGAIAGDWWDAVLRPDGSIGLVIADVSGHGVTAGVVAVQMRTALRSALVDGASPARALATGQAALTSGAHFVTAIVAVLDEQRLTWANAGHPAAIVVGEDKGASTCPPTGPLISALGGSWDEAHVDFGPGDVLFAFTDGLPEAVDAAGAELEEAELIRWIRAEDRPVRTDPDELIARIMARARHRAVTLSDDLTIICASRPA